MPWMARNLIPTGRVSLTIKCRNADIETPFIILVTNHEQTKLAALLSSLPLLLMHLGEVVISYFPYLPEYRSHRCVSYTSKTGRFENNYLQPRVKLAGPHSRQCDM